MSSTEDKELKAGHAPAVKAGGMRITQKRTPSESEKNPAAANGEEGEEEQVSGSPPKSEKHKQEVLLQGVVTKGDKDFPPEAVKQYHDKPLPSKNLRPVSKPHNIQQPR